MNRRTMLVSVIVTILSLSLSSGAWATTTNTITHTGVDDIFLRESDPNNNQGDTRNLIGGQGSTQQFVTLMKFDLSEILGHIFNGGVDVTNVVLDLGTAMTCFSGSFYSTLHKYTDFDHIDATWNDPDGSAGSDSTPGGTIGTLLATRRFDVSTGEGNYAFSSTLSLVNYIQEAIDARESNVYFRIGNEGASTNTYAFLRTDQGSTYGTGRATLIVSYSRIPAEITRYQFDTTNDWNSVDTDTNTTANTYSNIIGGKISSSTQTKLTSGADTEGSANTLAAAIAANDYDSFTIDLLNGVSVTPRTLTYDYMAAHLYETITSYILFDADGDGFDTGDVLGSTTLTGPQESEQIKLDNQVDLSSLGRLEVSSLEFRIYYSDNSTSGGRYHKVDNIVVSADIGAARVAEYRFLSGSAVSTDVEPLTTASDYAPHGGGGISSTEENRYFLTQDVGGSTLSAAIAAGDYDSITLSITNDYSFTPDQFIYDYIMQNGYMTFTTYLLFDDEGDGFDVGDEMGHVDLVADPMGVNLRKTANSIDLTSIGTLNVSTFELRLYYTDNSTADNRIHRVDNIYLYGTLRSVPSGTLILLH